MTKDFSNPHKLGFMRVFQVMFAFNIVLTLAACMFLIKGNYELGFADILDLVNLIFDGVSFWLIWQRKKFTRIFIICFSLFNILAGSIFNIATGNFDLLSQISASAFDIILIIYFSTSRRAKAALTQPFNRESKASALKKDVNYYQPKTWAFWRNLIMYFIVFSVVGHWMEAAYCTLIRFGILPGIYDPTSQIWSDWLYPFYVYGVGAVACALLLFPVKNFFEKHFKGRIVPLLLSFIVNAAVCTLIELVMGLLYNQPGPDGKLPLWDYSNMFCNFMGQICLQNALAFGLAATLMTWVVYPALESLIARALRDVINMVFVATIVGFLILHVLYFVNITFPGENVSDVDSTVVSEAPGSGGA